MDIENLDPALVLWGLFASAFISATVAPGGSEAVLAYLVHRGEHQTWLLLAVATTGNTLGAITTWGLGFLTARRYPAEHPEDSPARYNTIHRVRRYGLPILLLSWLPVVGDGFCFAAGWLRLSLWRSIVAIAVGKLARYAAIAYAFWQP